MPRHNAPAWILRLQAQLVRAARGLGTADMPFVREQMDGLRAVIEAYLAGGPVSVLRRDLDAVMREMAGELLNRRRTMLPEVYLAATRLAKRFAESEGLVVRGIDVRNRRVAELAIRGPMQGLPMGEWLRQTAQSTAIRMRRDAVTLRATGTQASAERSARTIVAQSRRRFANHLQAIDRMGASQVTARAHIRVWKATPGPDGQLARVVYVAVLDERTSSICQLLSGRTWAADSDAIRYPPQHPGCRSMLMPAWGVPRPEFSYAEWLAGAPRALQDEALGKARADAFRRGVANLREAITRPLGDLT